MRFNAVVLEIGLCFSHRPGLITFPTMQYIKNYPNFLLVLSKGSRFYLVRHQ